MNEDTTLSLIDTALASGSATALDPEERKLQELVLAVRNDAPSPDANFALRMDAKVTAGFPRRRRMPAVPRLQLAFAGAAASLLIVLVVVLSGTSGTTDRPSSSAAAPQAAERGNAPGATEQATTGASADSGAAPPPIPPAPGGFVGGSSRRVERSAALQLSTSEDKLDDLGNDVIRVSDRYRGIVMRSSVTQSGDKEPSTGSFDLRIPVRNLPSALRDLSALATVESRTENADDVTASFVSARTRLQEFKAERRGLLRRLELATTDQAAAAIRARIRMVNAQIESQMTAMREMRRRTSYAAVSVTLTSKPNSGGTGGIGDGARDLRDSLVDAANISLRVLGVALPIGLVLGLMWLVGGRVTRRRREAALD